MSNALADLVQAQKEYEELMAAGDEYFTDAEEEAKATILDRFVEAKMAFAEELLKPENVELELEEYAEKVDVNLEDQTMQELFAMIRCGWEDLYTKDGKYLTRKDGVTKIYGSVGD